MRKKIFGKVGSAPITMLRMNFDTSALSRIATAGGLELTVTVDLAPPGGTTMSAVEETTVASRELGLPEDPSIKRGTAS